MSSNDHTEGNKEFHDFLRCILDTGCLENTIVRGIIKQVIDKGLDSLSFKQMRVFSDCVLDEYTISKCSRCGGDIIWLEMLEALNNGGLCGWCQHQVEKDN